MKELSQEKKSIFLKELTSYIQQKGFVWGPEPEIYGGLAGFYTYGPMGKALKNNVENVIRKVFQKHQFWEVECPVIQPAPIWKASGHLGNFTDPVIKCSKCKSSFRVDNLIKEITGKEPRPEKYLEEIKNNNIKCPNCKSDFEEKIDSHNLMMKTTIGLDTEAFNRPETATTSYLPFLRYVTYFRNKMPFGIFQIGKAFRNEISPRQHVIRGREFTQAEGQLFILADQKNNYKPFETIKDIKVPLYTIKNQTDETKHEMVSLQEALDKKYIKSQAYAFFVHLAYELFKAMGIPSDRIRLRQHLDNEKAFYADDAWDVEVLLNTFGWIEMCGVHDRTNYDLTQHAKESKTPLEFIKEGGVREIPHVIEIAFGTDRPTYALMDIFYDKKEKDQGKTILKVPYSLAPIQVAVFPLMKKEGMPEKANEVFLKLTKHFRASYDVAGSIGKRYLRMDEVGTPFCITVDYDSLKEDTVTIRDRDSTKQIRIKIKELMSKIEKFTEGSTTPEEFITAE